MRHRPRLIASHRRSTLRCCALTDLLFFRLDSVVMVVVPAIIIGAENEGARYEKSLWTGAGKVRSFPSQVFTSPIESTLR